MSLRKFLDWYTKSIYEWILSHFTIQAGYANISIFKCIFFCCKRNKIFFLKFLNLIFVFKIWRLKILILPFLGDLDPLIATFLSEGSKGSFIQGIPSQTGKSNLALREGRKDISHILLQFFSRKYWPILISVLIFIKNKWKIMKNHKNC